MEFFLNRGVLPICVDCHCDHHCQASGDCCWDYDSFCGETESSFFPDPFSLPGVETICLGGYMVVSSCRDDRELYMKEDDDDNVVTDVLSGFSYRNESVLRCNVPFSPFNNHLTVWHKFYRIEAPLTMLQVIQFLSQINDSSREAINPKVSVEHMPPTKLVGRKCTLSTKLQCRIPDNELCAPNYRETELILPNMTALCAAQIQGHNLSLYETHAPTTIEFSSTILSAWSTVTPVRSFQTCRVVYDYENEEPAGLSKSSMIMKKKGNLHTVTNTDARARWDNISCYKGDRDSCQVLCSPGFYFWQNDCHRLYGLYLKFVSWNGTSVLGLLSEITESYLRRDFQIVTKEKKSSSSMQTLQDLNTLELFYNTPYNYTLFRLRRISRDLLPVVIPIVLHINSDKKTQNEIYLNTVELLACFVLGTAQDDAADLDASSADQWLHSNVTSVKICDDFRPLLSGNFVRMHFTEKTDEIYTTTGIFSDRQSERNTTIGNFLTEPTNTATTKFPDKQNSAGISQNVCSVWAGLFLLALNQQSLSY